MKIRLCFLVAGSLLSLTAYAGDWNCKERHDGYASLPVEAAPVESPIASAPVPAAPTSPELTQGKILLAGDAPCNPKVTVCED